MKVGGRVAVQFMRWQDWLGCLRTQRSLLASGKFCIKWLATSFSDRVFCIAFVADLVDLIMVSAAQYVANQLVLRPLVGLTVTFVLWKSVLLALAAAAPGYGYDTSTSLLVAESNHYAHESFHLGLTSKLTRWDAIYFVQLARRGHIFEQEWAFGKGLSTVLRLLPGGKVNQPDAWSIVIVWRTH